MTGEALQNFMLDSNYLANVGFGMATAPNIYPAKREIFWHPNGAEWYENIEKVSFFFNIDDIISYGDTLTVYVKKFKDTHTQVFNYEFTYGEYYTDIPEHKALYEKNYQAMCLIQNLLNIAYYHNEISE